MKIYQRLDYTKYQELPTMLWSRRPEIVWVPFSMDNWVLDWECLMQAVNSCNSKCLHGSYVGVAPHFCMSWMKYFINSSMEHQKYWYWKGHVIFYFKYVYQFLCTEHIIPLSKNCRVDLYYSLCLFLVATLCFSIFRDITSNLNILSYV